MLDERVAPVTGGSAGIEKCMSLLFAEKGADVAVVASADVGKAQAAVDEIAAVGGKARAYRRGCSMYTFIGIVKIDRPHGAASNRRRCAS